MGDIKSLTQKFKCPHCGKKVSYGKSKYHKCTFSKITKN